MFPTDVQTDIHTYGRVGCGNVFPKRVGPTTLYSYPTVYNTASVIRTLTTAQNG